MNPLLRWCVRWPAFCCALFLAGSAVADESPEASAVVAEADEDGPAVADESLEAAAVVAEAEEDEEDDLPLLGLVVDAGVPDGMNLGIVVRPLDWLRLHVSASYNLATWGIRGGVAYVPFDYWITPSLVVEGGTYFPGSLRDAMRTYANVDSEYVPDRILYHYFNAHLGLELGSDWFTFFLRGGYSYLDMSLRPPDSAEDGLRFEEDARITAWLPSAKLGFVVYFY